MATVDLGDWQEQWKRVLRWHGRITVVGDGITNGLRREDVVDTVLAFFPICYHFGDALVRSGVKTEGEVRNFVKASDALSLCRDLTIAVKHFEITQPYRPIRSLTTTADPQVFGGTHRRSVFGEHWSVKTDAGSTDMFELADECVAAWRAYLPPR